MATPATKLSFPGATGELLAARLDVPEGDPTACALFAHCFTCGKDIVAASRISAGLVAAGIAVLRFDFTGLGSSDGDFANTNFASNIGDLVAAAGALREQFEAPSLLIGHSLGGAAVLAAARHIPEVQAVATIAAPYDPSHVTGLFAGSLDTIEANGRAEVSLAGRSFTITHDFVQDVQQTSLEQCVAELKRALLVFHSPVDNLVSIDNARDIYLAAKHPKSFVALDGADHLLTNRSDAMYVADVLAAWSRRYLSS